MTDPPMPHETDAAFYTALGELTRRALRDAVLEHYRIERVLEIAE